MDITRVIPCPTPVRVGQSLWLVHPLKLRDLAMLQGYVKARIPDPVTLALDDVAAQGLVNRARHRRLMTAYLEAETWPPRYGSAAAAEVLDTADGRMFVLSVIADRSGWTVEQLRDLVEQLDDSTLERVELAAFGADPIDVAAALMGLNEPTDDEGSKDLNWAEAFKATAEETGWTFEQIADLTISQWLAYRSGGKVDRSVTPPPGMDLDTFRRRIRDRFQGLHLPE